MTCDTIILPKIKDRVVCQSTAEDELVGWHLRLNGHEFEQTPGDGEGQGSLVCCSSWGCRVRHDLETEQQQQMIRVYHLIHG